MQAISPGTDNASYTDLGFAVGPRAVVSSPTAFKQFLAPRCVLGRRMPADGLGCDVYF